MAIGFGICGFLCAWHLCMLIFRKCFESSYGIYVFLILTECFAVIGPAGICVVSLAIHLGQNAIYLNLFLDFVNSIVQIYLYKYFGKGAPCSPHSYHWCFLIGVMDVFIGLMSVLQFYHLGVMCSSRRHIMSSLREGHRRKASKKRRLKAQRRRDREAEMSRGRERESAEGRQRQVPQDIQPPPRPEKGQFSKSYIDDWDDKLYIEGCDGVAMHNVQPRVQPHSEYSHRTYSQHQDTVRGRSTKTRRGKPPKSQSRGRSQGSRQRNPQRAQWPTYSSSDHPLPRPEPTYSNAPMDQ
jgi:hypothetical protein